MRVHDLAGTPVEDLGVRPAHRRRMTRRDLLEGNPDLPDLADVHLDGRPRAGVDVEEETVTWPSPGRPAREWPVSKASIGSAGRRPDGHAARACRRRDGQRCDGRQRWGPQLPRTISSVGSTTVRGRRVPVRRTSSAAR
jgi:hypothetical protein